MARGHVAATGTTDRSHVNFQMTAVNSGKTPFKPNAEISICINSCSTGLSILISN